MKCSELWLRDWVLLSSWDRDAIAATLTMSGLEVESYHRFLEIDELVVVGQVLTVTKHPEAARLNVCEVNIGGSESLSIVCGASNVVAGMRVPVALPGTVLPGGLAISKTILRGVPSSGMLCAAGELGLPDEIDGLMALPEDAPLGMSVAAYLLLNDYLLHVAITPNRGDCMSVRGVARELAVLMNATLQEPSSPSIATSDASIPIEVSWREACPRYAGRAIRGINPHAKTPWHISIRLQQNGIRTIHPLVDITNYVMLEWGQPMHAFDLAKITGGIRVRAALPHEKLVLLDEQEVTLTKDTLLIADHEKPLVIAGVMGGLHSGISGQTTDVFLESAHFNPNIVAKQRERYQLQSESSQRFERGVDPELVIKALDYATSLILSICGGTASPMVLAEDANQLPKRNPIRLSLADVNAHLGLALEGSEVTDLLSRLAMVITPLQDMKDVWMVIPPSHRFDVLIAADLIEEVARLYGYDHIPTTLPKSEILVPSTLSQFRSRDFARDLLVNQGFQEIISYSFVSQELQEKLNPSVPTLSLENPISAAMAVMRTNLWPGLIETVRYNQSRQQSRLKLFECGRVFVSGEERTCLGLALSGPRQQEQWGVPIQSVDFFDLKGYVHQILANLCGNEALRYAMSQHASLHPFQQALVHGADGRIHAILGALHPALHESLELTHPVFLSELYLDNIKDLEKNKSFHEVSKYPGVRRDIALLVESTIPAGEISDTIKSVSGDWLKELIVFDIYQGEGVPSGQKSIAFGLVFQSSEKTLVDAEISLHMDRVVAELQSTYGAILRS